MLSRTFKTLFFVGVLALIVLEPTERKQAVTSWTGSALRTVASVVRSVANRVDPVPQANWTPTQATPETIVPSAVAIQKTNPDVIQLDWLTAE